MPSLTRILVPLTVACSISLSAAAQLNSHNNSSAKNRKEPWKWTLEERIASRTNPADAAARMAEAQKHLKTGSTQRGRPIVDRFTGRTHPELFLPAELFEQLVSMGFHGDAASEQAVRRGLMPELRRHGFPEDFWQRLQVAATIYIADQQTLMRLGAGLKGQTGPARERIQQAIAVQQSDLCRSRAAALAAARAEFGSDRFDRFLYEFIAPNMFHVADSLQTPAALRRMEEGCR